MTQFVNRRLLSSMPIKRHVATNYVSSDTIMCGCHTGGGCVVSPHLNTHSSRLMWSLYVGYCAVEFH